MTFKACGWWGAQGRVKRASVVMSSAASSASGARSERERRCSQSTGYSDSDEEGVLDHAERPGVEAEAVDAAIALHVGMNTPAGSVHGAVLYYQVYVPSSVMFVGAPTQPPLPAAQALRPVPAHSTMAACPCPTRDPAHQPNDKELSVRIA